MFSEKEIEYLKSQRIGRIATVSPRGQPDVVPVSYELDGNSFWIGGATQEIFVHSIKYLNVSKGNNKVGLVVDDLISVDPWRARSIKIYGTAEVLDHNGRFGPGKYLKITPKISWSFGINSEVQPNYRESGARLGQWRTKTIH